MHSFSWSLTLSLMSAAAALDYSGLSPKLQLVRGDFLQVQLPPFDALVANIPYQVSKLKPSWPFHSLHFHRTTKRAASPTTTALIRVALYS